MVVNRRRGAIYGVYDEESAYLGQKRAAQPAFDEGPSHVRRRAESTGARAAFERCAVAPEDPVDTRALAHCDAVARGRR